VGATPAHAEKEKAVNTVDDRSSAISFFMAVPFFAGSGNNMGRTGAYSQSEKRWQE